MTLVSYKNIERLNISGTSDDDNIVGKNGNDTLNPGSSGNDTVDGKRQWYPGNHFNFRCYHKYWLNYGPKRSP